LTQACPGPDAATATYPQVNANDRAEDVAKRMGMSMQQMWDLNYGLQQSGGMLDAGGQELCVVPNSCLGMKSTVYSDLAYRYVFFLWLVVKLLHTVCVPWMVLAY